MLFVIHALDRPGALSTRLEHYPAHRAFLDTAGEYGVHIVMSGPLVADDNETMVGSMFLVEAPDRASAERFNQADPFAKAGLWSGVSITAFLRRRG